MRCIEELTQFSGRKLEKYFIWTIFSLGIFALIFLFQKGNLFLTSGLTFFILFLVLALLDFQKALLLSIFIVIISPEQAQVDPGYPLPIITLSRAVIAVIFLVWIVRIIAKKEEYLLKKVPLKWQFTLYLGTFFLSGLFSILGRNGIFQFLSLTFERFILFLIVFASVNRKNYKTYLNVIIGAMLLLSILGIIEKRTSGWNPVSYLPPPKREILAYRHTYRYGYGLRYSGIRAMATTPHAIALGGMLAMLVPFVFLFGLFSKRLKDKYIYFLILLLMLLCIYYTHSRGPWAEVGIEFLLLAFLVPKSKKIIFIGLILFIIAMIIRPGVYHTLKSSFYGSFGTGVLAGSTEYRKSIFLSTLEAVKSSPLRFIIGYGPGAGRYVGLTGYVFKRFFRFTCIDNGYASILLQQGIIGFTSFLIFLGSLIVHIVKALKHLNSDAKNVMIGFLSAIAGLVFILYTVAFLDWHQPGYLFWILTGIVSKIVVESNV